MLFQLFSSAMHAAETGRLPDHVVRYGIRRLLAGRLSQVTQGDVEVRSDRLRKFLQDCRSSPVAVVPELANEQHYEVPAEFFRRVLGERLKYSCCCFDHPEATLDAAEERALSVTCERAGLCDGMSILELGCGWGSLSLWMAEKFPNSRIHAVSNSRSQRQFIEERAQRNGLKNLKVTTADMNSFSATEQHDRVVSVEMFEHMRNHEELLRRVSEWLKPGGQLFVHIFCHCSTPYLFEGSGPQDWMAQQHFFSGGMMPSEELLLHCQKHLQLVDRWRWNGSHYARTCHEWLKRQDQHREEILKLFHETYPPQLAELWFQRWRIFFMSCGAELFDYRGGNEWFVSHSLFRKPA
ncbi:MAG: cyclopropane-fatty-acyl-phospholipid synthase family protein [Planctomycetaceae bacterium]